MHTTEKHHGADVRTLSEADLEQVSGGRMVGEEYLPLFMGLLGVALFLTSGTLNEGLHRR
jgi:hypothetical protein